MEDNKNESTGSNAEDREDRPPFTDAEYVGNVWGWNFSYISLIIILLTLAGVLARYCYVKTYYPERLEQPQQDTMKIINPMPE